MLLAHDTIAALQFHKCFQNLNNIIYKKVSARFVASSFAASDQLAFSFPLIFPKLSCLMMD